MHTAVGTVGQYFKNRAFDGLDIFEVGVEQGPGWRLDVKYGLGMFGLGGGRAKLLRLGQRSALTPLSWEEVAPIPFPLGAPLALAIWPFLVPEVKMMAFELLGIEVEAEEADEIEEATAWTTRLVCIAFQWRNTEEERAVGGLSLARSFPVGAELMAFVGVRARVYPVEILDFLIGVFGFDPAKDDEPRVHEAGQKEAGGLQ